MRMCQLIPSLTAGLVVSAPASAQLPLVWKFEKGQVYEVERSSAQKQSVTNIGKQLKEERSSIWHVKLEVKEKRADNFVVAATLNKVEQKLIGGADVELLDPKLS